MINNISIKNFKSILDENVPLSNLTVLTGLNSSGKSSVIQAIRMVLGKLKGNSAYFEGFGGYGELRSKHAISDSNIILEMNISHNEIVEKATLKLGSDGDENISEIKTEINYDYISADRFGPSVNLPSRISKNTNFSVGDKGQYCVDFYMNFEGILANKNLIRENVKSRTLDYQLEAWMHEISPEVKLKFTNEEKHDTSHIEIDGYRATNTGYGISFTLPILLSGIVLSSIEEGASTMNDQAKNWFDNNINCGSILLVENPEAHLHPKGQTLLGKFLVKVAACGVQVVVETHSDHVLDGMRIEVRNKTITPDEINIYFFEKYKNRITKKSNIEITQNGKIKNWPKGFFDQSMLNLRELAE